jgi:protocatechuate 3,4-dioxygenase beta subunit
VFHADSSGAYTRQSEMDESNARLFGFLRTGSDGRFGFTTIRPGGYRKPYDGRWIPQHIHFEISAANKQTRRFQMVFRDDPRMDAYWLAWARRQGNPVVDVMRFGTEQRCSLEIQLR